MISKRSSLPVQNQRRHEEINGVEKAPIETGSCDVGLPTMCQRKIKTKQGGMTPYLTCTTETQEDATTEIVNKDHQYIIRAVYRVVIGSTTAEIVNKDYQYIIRAVYRVVLGSTTAEIVNKDYQYIIRAVYRVVIGSTTAEIVNKDHRGVFKAMYRVVL